MLQNAPPVNHVPKNSDLLWGCKLKVAALVPTLCRLAHADCAAAVWVAPAEAEELATGLGVKAGIWSVAMLCA